MNQQPLGPKNLERGWTFYFRNAPTEEFGYYGDGFLEAARSLTRSFRQRRGKRQIDIVPILFLYRHSIELLAKAVILSGNRLMQQSGSGKDEEDLFASFDRSKHRLMPLLDQMKPVFEYASWEWYWPKSGIKSFDDVQRLIEALEDLDKHSYRFRYPTDLQGKRRISERREIGQRTILMSLDHLAEALDTAVFGLDALALTSSTT